jgi:hypothetical protein
MGKQAVEAVIDVAGPLAARLEAAPFSNRGFQQAS